MKICIYGAGASGGHFGVKLATAGHDVSVISRGTNLSAIKKNGLVLHQDGREIIGRVTATDNPAELGPQDVVIVGVKTPGLDAVAHKIGPLVGRDTRVIFPQNGIPWWYAVGLSVNSRRPPDVPIFRHADGFLALLRKEQIVGGLIYSANEIEAPGIIKNNSPQLNRLIIGAIEGVGSAIFELRAALEAAGISSPPINDIREAMWNKLILTNMSAGVLALITGNNASISRKDPALGLIYNRLVGEGLAIAAAYGYELFDKVDPEGAKARLNDHKPSMRQDFDAGRPMEIGEMLLAPAAFGRAADVPIPTLEAVAAIAARLARDKGLLPG